MAWSGRWCAGAALAACVLGAAAPAAADHTGFDGVPVEARETDEYVVLRVLHACCGPTTVGAVPGPDSVDYRTVDGTARAGTDYVATSGTLLLTYTGPNEIRVPLLDDAVADGEVRFTVVLSNPRGATKLDSRSRETVTLVDDEASAAAAPPTTARAAGAPAPTAPSPAPTVPPVTVGPPPAPEVAAASPAPGDAGPAAGVAQAHVPADDLRAAPGMELRVEAGPAGDETGGGGTGSAGVALVAGAGIGVGAAAVAARRRWWTWSATRA